VTTNACEKNIFLVLQIQYLITLFQHDEKWDKKRADLWKKYVEDMNSGLVYTSSIQEKENGTRMLRWVVKEDYTSPFADEYDIENET
jgi:hypothetical protein